MSLRISFDLEDDDLQHFRLIMHAARNAAARHSPADIVAAASELLQKIRGAAAPGFIVERLQKLDLMIRMISDLEWRLPHAESQRVLQALAYFTEPDDLIPDHIPGLGFLDDAIMIELLVRELHHETEAYQDFCEFRNRQLARVESTGARELRSRLEARRTKLQSRMRERRQRELKGGAGPDHQLLG